MHGRGNLQSPEDSTFAETVIARPTTTSKSGKGTPPPRENTLGALRADGNGTDKNKARKRIKRAKSLSKKRTEPLRFRVTAKFRRAFKRAATAHDCKKVELLERIFSEWSARDPAGRFEVKLIGQME